MNYGETLAYWYLRLNGFIPMRNFVLHRANIEGQAAADTDLLAVRFPNVYEEIGGQPPDWDNHRFEDWGLDLCNNIALVVEVKTGRINPDRRWWRRERLQAAVLRLGMIDRGQVPEIVADLEQAPAVQVGSWTIAKLLVTDQLLEDDSWFNLTLADADGFIIERIVSYKGDKRADRLRFPDDLMQYLAWKS